MIESLLLRSGRAEAQVLRDEVDSLREFPEGRRRLLVDSHVLIAHCREYPVQLRRHWDSFHKAAEGRAFPIDDLGPFFTLLLSLTETCQETVATVRQSLEEAEPFRSEWEAETGGALPAADLAALDAVAGDLRDLRSEVSRKWERLKSAPTAKRTLRTTAEIRAALGRGEYVSIEDAIARLDGTTSEAR